MRDWVSEFLFFGCTGQRKDQTNMTMHSLYYFSTVELNSGNSVWACSYKFIVLKSIFLSLNIKILVCLNSWKLCWLDLGVTKYSHHEARCGFCFKSGRMYVVKVWMCSKTAANQSEQTTLTWKVWTSKLTLEKNWPKFSRVESKLSSIICVFLTQHEHLRWYITDKPVQIQCVHHASLKL